MKNEEEAKKFDMIKAWLRAWGKCEMNTCDLDHECAGCAGSYPL